MGKSYQFECPKCGYRAKVSGRAESGSNFCVQTIHCRECKALYDALTRLKIAAEPGIKRNVGFPNARLRRRISDRPPTFESVLNRLPVAAGRRVKWVDFKIACPVSPGHKVQVWSEPGKCPRCGVYLERNALPFRLWE